MVALTLTSQPRRSRTPSRSGGGLEVGESRTFSVAWVEVPSLRVRRVDQTYRRLASGSDGGAQWEYGDPDHGTFRLTVDEGGVVIDYEGFARRVP